MGQVTRRLFQNVTNVDPFLWKSEHLNHNPYQAGSKEAELWGFAFLLTIDRHNLELPLPPSPVFATEGDYWKAVWARSQRVVGFEPYNVWPPEWAQIGGGAAYQKYVPKFSMFNNKLEQASNPYQAGDWGQSGNFGPPSADAVQWQREIVHARRNEAAFYIDPYGPGCWLRREGKPYEALVGTDGPAWNNELRVWQVSSMRFSMLGAAGMKWTDEADRWSVYKGYAHPGPDIDPSAYGPPSGRKAFPTTVEQMLDIIAGPTPSLPEHPTPSAEMLAHDGTLISAMYGFQGRQWLYNALTGQVMPLT